MFVAINTTVCCSCTLFSFFVFVDLWESNKYVSFEENFDIQIASSRSFPLPLIISALCQQLLLRFGFLCSFAFALL